MTSSSEVMCNSDKKDIKQCGLSNYEKKPGKQGENQARKHLQFPELVFIKLEILTLIIFS